MHIPFLHTVTDRLERAKEAMPLWPTDPLPLTQAQAEAQVSALDALERATYALRVKLMCDYNLGAIATIREVFTKEIGL